MEAYKNAAAFAPIWNTAKPSKVSLVKYGQNKPTSQMRAYSYYTSYFLSDEPV